MSQATTLAHAIDNASAARERVQDALARLDIEESDLRIETGRAARERAAAEEQLAAHRGRWRATRAARAALEQELATGKGAHAALAQALRDARARRGARLSARLASLEELDAARAGFTDAARVGAGGGERRTSSQQGAVADFIEVDRGYEKAVEALTGELLQHVIVPTHAHAARAAARHPRARAPAAAASSSLATRWPTAPQTGSVEACARSIRSCAPAARSRRRSPSVLPRAYIADSFDAAVAAGTRDRRDELPRSTATSSPAGTSSSAASGAMRAAFSTRKPR